MKRVPVKIESGTTVLITGAGSGIGRATALLMAERGATVLCVDIVQEAAEKVAAECEERGAPAASAYVVDVVDRAALEALAAEVSATHGRLDVVVNNAGVGMSGRFLDVSQADWEWIRGVNLDGVVNGCAVFGKAMVDAGRGHVVNVSSGLGYTPTATEPAYVTTKAAVLALSHCLRADWGQSGVGVTAICPGVINTPIIDRTRFVGAMDDPVRRERSVKMFRRGHNPDKVAAAIVDAVERDRAVVPVGFEAKVGWWFQRFAPISVRQLLARGASNR